MYLSCLDSKRNPAVTVHVDAYIKRMQGALGLQAGTFILSLHYPFCRQVSASPRAAAGFSHVLLLLCSFSPSHQLYCRSTRLPKVYVKFSISTEASALSCGGILVGACLSEGKPHTECPCFNSGSLLLLIVAKLAIIIIFYSVFYSVTEQ